MAAALRDDFITLPSAVLCFKDDFEAATGRTEIITNTFGERPLLKLMYAALIRASEAWRGISNFQQGAALTRV